MSTKLCSLISFILLLGLMAAPTQADLGEGLVAYWPLDEGGGAMTADVSGNGINGTLNGGPTWVEGKLGGALDFDGDDDYVDCGNPPILDFSTNDFTISVWAKTTDPGGDNLVFSKGGDSGGGIRYEVMFRDNSGGDARLLVDDDSDKYDPDTDDKELSDGQWHHLVAMRRNGTELRMYVDGVEDQGLTDHGESTIPADYDLSGTSQHNAHIGANYHHGNNEVQKFFTGMIDDVAVWNRALTEEEIAYLWNNGDGNPVGVADPGRAGDLFPANEASDVLRDVVLTWSPGEFAVTHDVYFGTVFEDVNTARADALVSPGQDANSYDPGRLVFGQVYYWRVDEVNGTPDNTIFEGPVQSFTVEPKAVPVVPMAATASSSSQWMDPENTINGSGLDPNTGMHSTLDIEMWISDRDQDPNEPVSITYEFDRIHRLHGMKVWNSNQGMESVLGYGFKEMIITYSTDGAEWTRLGGEQGIVELAQAPGDREYPGESVELDNAVARYVRLTGVSNWSQFFNQYSLSEVQFSALPMTARSPDPGPGAGDVDPRTTVLSWRPGRDAGQHDVFVSSDPNALGSPQTVLGNSLALNTLNLSLDTTYYWQVNEVNETLVPRSWTGDLWNFTTSKSFVVEDFEGYGNTSPDRPFQTWLDGYGYSADEFFPAGYGGNGTGAGIGHDIWTLSSPHYGGDIMETDSTIPGSGQSMPLNYRNSGGVTSETQRTFAVPQDWIVNGLQTLSIAFRGTPGNTGTLYAKINNTKISYDLSASDIALSAWQVWNIDLATVGGDLNNVTTLSLGIDGANASGMILIDDIRLYAQPGEMTTPEVPSSAGLLALYSFEGNANDSSGHGLHGTLASSQIVSPGAAGQGSAVQMTPGTYVDLGNPGALDFGTGDWTITAWYKTAITGTDEAERGVIIGNGGDNAGGHRYALIMNESTAGIINLVTDDDATKIQANSVTPTNDDQWHFVAGQREGTEIRIYIDGQLEATETCDPDYDLSGTSQHNAYIGAITDNSSGTPYKMLVGSVDEVAIYDRALSAGEILWLAGRTTPFHKPF